MDTKLSFKQQDLLTEIGSIGTGHAATAMADLLGKKVTIDVPKVELVSFAHVADYVGGSEQVVACVYLEVLGDLPGTVLVMFDHHTSGQLLSVLVQDNFAGLLSLTALQRSALKEMGNILAGSYLSALSDFVDKNLQISVPNLAIDMADAVFSVPMIKLGSKADYALLVQATFFKERHNSGYIIFIPEPIAASRIMEMFREYVNG